MRTKVCIEIPKEFEEHFSTDRFEDSLHRLNADAHLLAGNYEQETVVMLINAFKNAYAIDDDDEEWDDEEWDDEEYTHKSYRVQKYKEQDTACDKCPDFKACAAEGKVIEITTSQDTRHHFMRGLMVVCNRSL